MENKQTKRPSSVIRLIFLWISIPLAIISFFYVINNTSSLRFGVLGTLFILVGFVIASYVIGYLIDLTIFRLMNRTKNDSPNFYGRIFGRLSFAIILAYIYTFHYSVEDLYNSHGMTHSGLFRWSLSLIIAFVVSLLFRYIGRLIDSSKPARIKEMDRELVIIFVNALAAAITMAAIYHPMGSWFAGGVVPKPGMDWFIGAVVFFYVLFINNLIYDYFRRKNHSKY